MSTLSRLVGGAAAHAEGHARLGDMLWAAGALIALALVGSRILADVLKKRAGVDVNALLAIGGALLLRGELDPRGPTAADVQDFQRILYGLHAVLRLHFAQEEELYASLSERYHAGAPGEPAVSSEKAPSRQLRRRRPHPARSACWIRSGKGVRPAPCP